MDSMRGQGGIQMLLTAEQEAQQIVSASRKLKIARLKQAKEEAEQEAVSYRASMEKEYQRKVSKCTGSSGWNVKRLDEETHVKIQGLKGATMSVGSDMVGMLIKQITIVRS